MGTKAEEATPDQPGVGRWRLGMLARPHLHSSSPKPLSALRRAEKHLGIPPPRAPNERQLSCVGTVEGTGELTAPPEPTGGAEGEAGKVIQVFLRQKAPTRTQGVVYTWTHFTCTVKGTLRSDSFTAMQQLEGGSGFHPGVLTLAAPPPKWWPSSGKACAKDDGGGWWQR